MFRATPCVQCANSQYVNYGLRSKEPTHDHCAKYSKQHGGRFCNSIALTSSSTRISSGLNPKFKDTEAESRFKGGQRRLVKCSGFATWRHLTSTSTKCGRANNAWNMALVSETKPVEGIPTRSSFCNCVSMAIRWGKVASTWGQSESDIWNMV